MDGFKLMEFVTWPLWMQIIGVLAAVGMIATTAIVVSESKKVQ